MPDRTEAPRCAIFDCDGTLVDSERLGNLALALALAELDVDEVVDSLTQRYRGWRFALILEDLEQRHGRRLPPDFQPSYRARVERMFEADLNAVPGVADALSSITIPVCVASSAPRQKLEQALRVTGLSHFFGANVYSSYEVGSWKPEPGIFLHAARQLNVPAGACAVVEDSVVGAEAASAAGMRCYLFDPSESLAPSATFGATIFKRMRDLPHLLASAPA